MAAFCREWVHWYQNQGRVQCLQGLLQVQGLQELQMQELQRVLLKKKFQELLWPPTKVAVAVVATVVTGR